MPVVIVGAATGTHTCNVLWQATMPTVTQSGSVAGYPAINLIDDATWNAWRTPGVFAWAKYDFGAATEIDGVGISGHNLGSTGVTLQIQSSTDDSTWTTRHTITPLTDEDLFFVMPSFAARYWRLRLSDQCTISNAVMGKRLQFPNAPTDGYVPLHHARTYKKLRNESMMGQRLSTRTLSIGAETEVTFDYMVRSWADGALRPFESWYNQGGSFFYASCPDMYPLDMGYCWASEEDGRIDVTYIEADKLASVSFGIESYVS